VVKELPARHGVCPCLIRFRVLRLNALSASLWACNLHASCCIDAVVASGSAERERGVEVEANNPAGRAEYPIEVPVGEVFLQGILVVPPAVSGIVLFAHGSGSGRISPRNTFVARLLQQGGLGTLLIDLLTEQEALDRRVVFDIPFLAGRLVAATVWLQQQPETRHLRIGYFGASTGAGAALQAAAREPDIIGAVVSRGGRPDLAAPYLHAVRAPTLLIVGGNDVPVIALNRDAYDKIEAPKEFVIVPGATHLFEEQGALEKVAHHALRWFDQFLTRQSRRAA
jgi:putative phosphoribosyl transferase